MPQSNEGGHSGGVGLRPLQVEPRGLGSGPFLLLDVVDLLVDQLRHLLAEVDELGCLLGQDFVLAFEGSHEEVLQEVLHVLEISLVVLRGDALSYLRDEVPVSDYRLGELLGLVQEGEDVVQHPIEVVDKCVVRSVYPREDRQDLQPLVQGMPLPLEVLDFVR